MTRLEVPGFLVQEDRPVVAALIPGRWLLKRTTPTWRIEDPIDGFQRVVREDRAREIAVNVLDQRRTFPNAIVLATDVSTVGMAGGQIALDLDIRFLVVDGQHRLWAQNFSDFDANYLCVVHLGLTEVEMAHLFLEINDTQKRVPSSLRWDLVRLVRPDDDLSTVEAADLVFSLATDDSSPLYQAVDLTGEMRSIELKQGSLAPGIRRLLRASLKHSSYDESRALLVQFFMAVRDQEPDEWTSANSRFYKARVIRALLILLDDIVKTEGRTNLSRAELYDYLQRIDPVSLDQERIKAAQGNAGIASIHREMKSQVFAISEIQ